MVDREAQPRSADRGRDGSRSRRSTERSACLRRCTASRFKTTESVASSRWRRADPERRSSFIVECCRSACAELGLPSLFDVRLGNPSTSTHSRWAYPSVTIIVPHFGAGFLREALMVADLARTFCSTRRASNSWINVRTGPNARVGFERALSVLGPDRLLFGSDSSFFPRGWVKDVYQRQSAT